MNRRNFIGKIAFLAAAVSTAGRLALQPELGEDEFTGGIQPTSTLTNAYLDEIYRRLCAKGATVGGYEGGRAVFYFSEDTRARILAEK